MDGDELRRLLNEGIAAIRKGDRARGREMLLRVVAADEGSEPAWLWLATVMDEPADQLTALENVLTLNPRNLQAQAQADALRTRLGHVEEAAEEPAAETQVVAEVFPPETATMVVAEPKTEPVRGSAADIIDAEDDPYQCAYCGKLTVEEDERCPHCRRSLLAPGFWRGGGYQYTLLILVGLQVQAAVVQTAAAYLLAFIPNSIAVVPGAEVVAASPLFAAVARGVVWGILLMMLLGDSLAAYRWAALAAAADLAWLATGWGLGWVGQELALLNGLLSLFIGLGGLGATVGQLQAQRRLRVIPDRGIQSAALYDERARHYARRDMWAMAALHWQKAIARQPREPELYKSLGAAQARLGRYTQAVKTLRSGAEVAPEDGEFARLIQAVRSTARIS